MDEAPGELRVGVVGLGVMGASMARHLSSQNLAVVGFDLDAAACARVRADGIALSTSTTALASEVEVLVISLPSAPALEEVTAEIAAAPHLPRFVIETSTLSLLDKEGLRASLSPRGTVVLDCPISGTGEQMARGDAVIYASGDAAAFELVRPILESFSRRAYYTGTFGNGTRLKFVANLLVAVHNVAAAEALALAQRSGLAMTEALEALLDGAGASKILEVRGPTMLERRYLPGAMRMALFEKDLQLIADYARDAKAATPLFTSSLAIYEAARDSGLHLEDTAAVFEVLLPPTD